MCEEISNQLILKLLKSLFHTVLETKMADCTLKHVKMYYMHILPSVKYINFHRKLNFIFASMILVLEILSISMTWSNLSIV